MGRIIALDIGVKRIGMAVTDPMQMIASPHATVAAADIWTTLQKEFDQELPDEVVIGMPKGLDAKATDGTEVATKFARTFKQKFPKMKLYEVDERFTSKMALQSMHEVGMKTKGNKALIDELSATIILQGYLQSKSR